MPKRRWVNYLFQEGGGWRKGFVLFPLLVVSWIYGIVVRVRGALYQRGLFKTRKLSCKVISVGNITVGGTGKTPLVAALAKELCRQGWKVGILSRGYKGRKERTGGIVSDGVRMYLSAVEAGDEPCMLARMLPQVPVLVGSDRYTMGVLACERFGTDVLILDDGFQHMRIKRDVDIVLIDAGNGVGNGHLFPRGPLREPLSGLRRASVLVLTKTDALAPRGAGEAVYRRHAPTLPLYHSRYKPVSILEAATGKRFSPAVLKGKKVFAFAGIADPDYFVKLLKGLGADIIKEVHFPDHYNYGLKDLMTLREHKEAADFFVTTEKDYVKLQNLPHDDLLFYILVIEQEISDDAFYHTVRSLLSS